jgi:Apea-like HEPN
MSSREALAAGFAEVLAYAQRDYAQFITSRGLPFVEPVQRVAIMQNPTNTGWFSEDMNVEESTAARYLFSWGQLKDELRDKCLDLSTDLVAEYSATLPFWAPLSGGVLHVLLGLPADAQIEFDSTPNLWVARHIVVPALAGYLQELRSANSEDPALATRITEEALDLASARDLKMTSLLPVLGIDMELQSLAAGEVVVRQLNPLERGGLWEQAGGRPLGITSAMMLYSHQLVWTVPTHVIEVTTSLPRMAQARPNWYHSAVLSAFYLHGYPLAGPGMITSDLSPRWVGYGRMGTPAQLRRLPMGSKELSQEDLNSVWDTLQRLRRYNLEQPSNSRDLAVHRFFLGSIRENPVDSLLDYIIALECFLLPYDPATRHSDLSYRFRLHGAYYIAATVQERRTIWKQLRDLYDLRSRLVHGSNYPSQSEIEASVQIARELTQRALLKAIRSHFPRVEEFNEWALGEAAP